MYDEDYYREAMRANHDELWRWLTQGLRPGVFYVQGVPMQPQPKPKRIATEQERAHYDLVLARLEAQADQVDALIAETKGELEEEREADELDVA